MQIITRKSFWIIGTAVLGLALALAGPGLTESRAEDVSFKGETVKVYVGFGPGSSNDTYLRQFAPYLQKHLPGNPTVIVDNKAGGAGIVMGNYFYNTVKPDGREVGFYAVAVMNMWLGNPNVKFDITKMPLLGGFGVNVVTLVHESTGIKTAKDLLNAKKEIYMGASSRTSPNHIGDTAILKIFGIPHKGLTGIRNSGRAFQGMRAGELTMYSVASDIYLLHKDALNRDGIYAIYQRGILEADGSVTNQTSLGLPTVDEVVRTYKPEAANSPIFKALIASLGVYAGAKPFFLPQGTDQNYVDVWSKSLAAAREDTEYVTMFEKQSGELAKWFGPEDGRKLLTAISANFADEDVMASIREISAKK